MRSSSTTSRAGGGGDSANRSHTLGAMSIPENSDPGPVAIGTWSGGRFMHFGEPLDDQRYLALITPDESIRTVMTADVYGTGEADRMLGRAIAGRRRDEICVVGAVGHDFYEGERDGPRGFPRFTDPRLRGPERYGDYLVMAAERSLERIGIDSFDLLLLHNPDRIGYTSDSVWNAMAWQPARAAHGAFRPRHRRIGVEAEIGDVREPFLERDPDLHARQVGADAAVDAEAE